MQKQFDVVLAELLDNLMPSSVEPVPLLLAVSGGIDSVCMAELFLHSSVKQPFAIAHCNFHLRGEESDEDTLSVLAWGGKNGIKVHKMDFDTMAYASKRGLSIEMAARELRYSWFGSLCEEYGYAAVCTAHNTDDNAETLLLNLVRGTGLKGICGMKAVSPLPCFSDCRHEVTNNGTSGNYLLFRPLLSFSRKQIEGYLWKHGINYRVDSTNADSAYKRNKIRNEVFPLLKSMNPSLIRTLNREMGYFSELEAMADEFLTPQIEGLRSVSDDGSVTVRIPALLAAKYWRTLLYRILEPYGFNSSTVASVSELIQDSADGTKTFSGKSFNSASHNLLTAPDSLIVTPLAAEGQEKEVVSPEPRTLVTVEAPGTYSLGKEYFTVELVKRSTLSSLKTESGTTIMDADKCPFPFVVRIWQQGDWLCPLGMKGRRKKVSDLFGDLKYNLHQKASALLLAPVSSPSAQHHVLALVGERIDDTVKVTDSTTDCIVITLC